MAPLWLEDLASAGFSELPGVDSGWDRRADPDLVSERGSPPEASGIEEGTNAETWAITTNTSANARRGLIFAGKGVRKFFSGVLMVKHLGLYATIYVPYTPILKRVLPGILRARSSIYVYTGTCSENTG